MSTIAKTKLDNVAKAQAAWGNDMPDWIIALAEACNAETQAAVARKLSYSGSTVSQVLSNTYQLGDMARVEAIVRGALMAENISCPVIGDMGRDVCQGWQKRPFSTASANAVRMYQACRNGCPHSRITPQTDHRKANADAL